VSTSVPGATASHSFNFIVQSAITIGSIEFEYCDNSPLFDEVCNAPTGLSLSAASLASESGVVGFTINSASANKLIIGRAPAAVTPPVTANYLFNDITNPSQDKTTFYVRISTYASNDGTGAREETGAVAFSTSSGFSVGGYVPPYLTFCVGITVSSNCSSASGNYLSFGELSTIATKSLTSQFAVATNDPAGYITSLSGLTMTSGNNVINGMAFPALSNTGTSQFGLNLRVNTNPSVGTDKSGVGTGNPEPDFNTANQYIFKNDNIASSNLPSDFNVFTVSYVVNIPDGQPAGIYTTTLTYIATVQF